MTIRWTEKEYRDYCNRIGKQPEKKRNKRQPVVRKIRPSNVEEIDGGLLITLYKIHPSLNEWTSWHHFKKTEVKAQWEQELWALLARYRHLKLTKARVFITYHMPDWEQDKDNYTPKFIMDGLVKAGVLFDDNKDIVELEWAFKRSKMADIRSEIRITWQGREMN